MGKKTRKNPVPAAKVIDQSGAAVAKAAATQAAGKKKAAMGKMISLRTQEDSDEEFDDAPALKFDKEEIGDSDLEMEEDVEEMEEGEEGEEFEEMEEDEEDGVGSDDSFGVLGEQSDDDSSGSGDFDDKVAKNMEKLQAQQAEAAKETMMTAARRKAKVFGKDKDEGSEEEEGEEEEEEEEPQEVVTIQQRKDRIQEVLRVIEELSQQREGDHSRTEYLAILKDDLMQVYDYNEWLTGKLMELFSPRELFEFLETNEKQRPLTIRTNTLKVSRRDLAQSLTRKGMSVEPTGSWCKVGLQIFESDVAVGSTAEYLSGQYLVQSASSFIPVLAMEPGENMRILDMAAAPGGKTTHIAQCMKNTGSLVANDVSMDRLIALRGNILRMGITNTIVTNYNGVGFERVMKNFDKVLLDAPCTGLGVISRDPRIKTTKTEKDVLMCASLQKKLILSAIDSCKVGGTIVYSTCSILVEENEATVDYALRERNIRVVDMGIPFGRPGMTKYRENRFHSSVALSKRYYPHAYNMDGFYVCKIEKLGHGPAAQKTEEDVEEKRGRKRKQAVKSQEGGVPEPPAKVLKRKQELKDAQNKPVAIEVVPTNGEKGTGKKKTEPRSRWKRKNEKDKAKKRAAKKVSAKKPPAAKQTPKKDATTTSTPAAPKTTAKKASAAKKKSVTKKKAAK